MQKCDNTRCPVCYPNWKEEEAAAKKRAEDDKQDCIDCWRFYQKKAEAIVTVDDPIARNRRINAAYAQLWLDDHRFQWAGLAAFASKQVGCGLLNAAEMNGKSASDAAANLSKVTSVGPAAWMMAYGAPSAAGAATAEGAAKVYQMLAKGNTALFLDIWPLHMFYKRFGLQRFERCLPERTSLRGSVVWPIADSVAFGVPTLEIHQGFEAIDSGNISKGVEILARHEQINILQPAMYDDPAFAMLMRTNQFAWALNIPTGSAREIQLALVNQCTVTGANARIELFSREPLANLADPRQRMAFVLRAAERFDQLLHHPLQKYDVENSIFLIAHPR
ncbi:hypothetical protein CI15_08780 [Paraburkholderia monticola]|uniref:Uncharacterized protein n=1 Tax=Paraburkholderia monticola TaxID=1399968 RepID=A0A149PVQ8_9BURK|nr:hypothetical protein [Paraburkholderia monticola]KXU89133.1 hypothetical protein CI15_08780 [Paraburkholderia monticola]